MSRDGLAHLRWPFFVFVFFCRIDEGCECALWCMALSSSASEFGTYLCLKLRGSGVVYYVLYSGVGGGLVLCVAAVAVPTDVEDCTGDCSSAFGG